MENYAVKIKHFNKFEHADLRLLNEGISISNTNKSILIGYKEVIDFIYDKDMYLHILYKKNNHATELISDEIIEINQEILTMLTKKCNKKLIITKEKNKMLEQIIDKGICQLSSNREGDTRFILTQKKIIFLNMETNLQIIINLKDIHSLEKSGLTTLKINYEINKQEDMYYTKLDQLIENILKYKITSDTYLDNINLKEKKTKTNNIKIITIILIISILILIKVILI